MNIRATVVLASTVTCFSDLVCGSSWLLLRQINLTVRADKENWLVFIHSLTLETWQVVLITTNLVTFGLGSESVIITQTTCWYIAKSPAKSVRVNWLKSNKLNSSFLMVPHHSIFFSSLFFSLLYICYRNP